MDQKKKTILYGVAGGAIALVIYVLVLWACGVFHQHEFGEWKTVKAAKGGSAAESDATKDVVKPISDYIEFYGIVPVTGEIQEDSTIKKGSLRVYILYKNISDKIFDRITFSLKGANGDSFFNLDKSFNAVTDANCIANDIAPGGPCENDNFTCFNDLNDLSSWGFALGVIDSLKIKSITIYIDGEELEFNSENGGLDGIQRCWKGFNYESDPSDFPL